MAATKAYRVQHSTTKTITRDIYDFTDEQDGIRILETRPVTKECTDVIITRNNEIECDAEFMGQLTDGIFENCDVTRFDEVHVPTENVGHPARHSVLSVKEMLRFIDFIREQCREVGYLDDNSVTLNLLDVNMTYYDIDGREHGWEDLLLDVFDSDCYSITYGDGNWVTIAFK